MALNWSSMLQIATNIYDLNQLMSDSIVRYILHALQVMPHDASLVENITNNYIWGLKELGWMEVSHGYT